MIEQGVDFLQGLGISTVSDLNGLGGTLGCTGTASVTYCSFNERSTNDIAHSADLGGDLGNIIRTYSYTGQTTHFAGSTSATRALVSMLS